MYIDTIDAILWNEKKKSTYLAFPLLKKRNK
jgi:hypothetical protein